MIAEKLTKSNKYHAIARTLESRAPYVCLWADRFQIDFNYCVLYLILILLYWQNESNMQNYSLKPSIKINLLI